METSNKVVCLWSGSQHTSSQVNVDRWIHGPMRTPRLQLSSTLYSCFKAVCLVGFTCLSNTNCTIFSIPSSFVYPPPIFATQQIFPSITAAQTHTEEHRKTRGKKKEIPHNKRVSLRWLGWHNYVQTVTAIPFLHTKWLPGAINFTPAIKHNLCLPLCLSLCQAKSISLLPWRWQKHICSHTGIVYI